jgi:hypothetical protein
METGANAPFLKMQRLNRLHNVQGEQDSPDVPIDASNPDSLNHFALHFFDYAFFTQRNLLGRHFSLGFYGSDCFGQRHVKPNHGAILWFRQTLVLYVTLDVILNFPMRHVSCFPLNHGCKFQDDMYCG